MAAGGEPAAAWERRDLGVLCLLRGEPERAKAELTGYATSGHFNSCGVEDRVLVERLLAALAPVEAGTALTLAGSLAAEAPDVDELETLPLTW